MKKPISFNVSIKLNKNSSKLGNILLRGDLNVSNIIIIAMIVIIKTTKYAKTLKDNITKIIFFALSLESLLFYFLFVNPSSSFFNFFFI